MALGSPINPTVDPAIIKPPVWMLSLPISIQSVWQQPIDPGGLVIADNGGSLIVDPTTISDATRHLLIINFGTLLNIRLVYPNTVTACTTAPVIQVFGCDANKDWESLYWDNTNAAGNVFTLTPDLVNDLNTGGYRYSKWMRADLDGCSQALLGVKTCAAFTGGNANLAFIQARVL